MLCPPHQPAPLVVNWFERHSDVRSLVLHVIGIPPTLIAFLLFPASLVLLSFRLFAFCVMLFVGGYLIQFLGHVIDRTEPGEWTALKRFGARLAAYATARPKQRQRVA